LFLLDGKIDFSGHNKILCGAQKGIWAALSPNAPVAIGMTRSVDGY